MISHPCTGCWRLCGSSCCKWGLSSWRQRLPGELTAHTIAHLWLPRRDVFPHPRARCLGSQKSVLLIAADCMMQSTSAWNNLWKAPLESKITLTTLYIRSETTYRVTQCYEWHVSFFYPRKNTLSPRLKKMEIYWKDWLTMYYIHIKMIFTDYYLNTNVNFKNEIEII